MSYCPDHTLHLQTVEAGPKYLVVDDGVRTVKVPRRLLRFGSKVSEVGRKSRLVLPEWFVQREALDG